MPDRHASFSIFPIYVHTCPYTLPSKRLIRNAVPHASRWAYEHRRWTFPSPHTKRISCRLPGYLHFPRVRTERYVRPMIRIFGFLMYVLPRRRDAYDLSLTIPAVRGASTYKIQAEKDAGTVSNATIHVLSPPALGVFLTDVEPRLVSALALANTLPWAWSALDVLERRFLHCDEAELLYL